MDPVQKIWMYENWLADQKDRAELAKNHAYLVGSFWNPEAVKSLMGDNTHSSTDEEFEESSRIVREANKDIKKKLESPKTHRRRRSLKG